MDRESKIENTFVAFPTCFFHLAWPTCFIGVAFALQSCMDPLTSPCSPAILVPQPAFQINRRFVQPFCFHTSHYCSEAFSLCCNGYSHTKTSCRPQCHTSGTCERYHTSGTCERYPRMASPLPHGWSHPRDPPSQKTVVVEIIPHEINAFAGPVQISSRDLPATIPEWHAPEEIAEWCFHDCIH